MKIFTIRHESVQLGAMVEEFALASGVTIAAITIGEQGRGRSLGVLPVKGAAPGDVITSATVSTTRSGRPCLIASPSPTDDDSDHAIVIMRTEYGFRGSCGHSGDFAGIKQTDRPWQPWVPVYDDPPGQVLAKGIVAQGGAGRMASGEQIIAVVPAGKVFRAWRTGRLYGAPQAHYYVYDGETVLTATWEERELLPDDHPLALSQDQIAALEEARRIEEAAANWTLANT